MTGCLVVDERLDLAFLSLIDAFVWLWEIAGALVLYQKC